MAELNPNRIVMGIAIEALRGTPETLEATDYDVDLLDVELIQYQSDHSVAGKVANGSLINTAKSYSRSRGATTPIKMEIKASATPTVEPAYFKVPSIAGFKTGVIDAGTNENFEFYYDGKPNCNTATISTDIEACDTTGYSKGIKGSVIADAKVGMEGPGAPLLFMGTVSGAQYSITTPVSINDITEDSNDCILGTGMVAAVGGTIYNFTKFEWSSNLGAAAVTDMSDANDTNISHYNLSDGGDPTLEFSAIPLQADAADDWSDLFLNVVDSVLTLENDEAKVIISNIQITDIQDSNETGVMVQDKTIKCGGIRVQLK